MLKFKVKQEQYKPNDLVIILQKSIPTVFRIRSIDSIKQEAKANIYRGAMKENSISSGGNALRAVITIPISAIIRKATQQEITKAERENKTR
jgi:hypothetical protein